LSEQPGILTEFFGARAGYLPEGSALFFGSLSHLALRGLENYAEETVKMFKVFSNMLKGGCSVAHVLLVPLGGIASAGLVRDLYDMDSWLRSGVVSNLTCLPASREVLWRTLENANKIALSIRAANAERVLYMPENFKTSSKIRMVSGEIDNLPVSISPLTEEDERCIMEQLLSEIADTYAIDINKYPILSRCNGAPVFDDESNGDARIFVIGASHAVRLVGGLAEKGLNIINLAKPGWKFDDEAACEIGKKLQNYGAGKEDCLIIDPLSNSIFCGSDIDGKLIDPIKEDGIWHIPGSLTVRSKPYIKQILQKLKSTLENLECKIILLVPIPRYISAPCCDNPEHISNRLEIEFAAEISGEMERVEEMLDAWAQSWAAPAMVLGFRAVADDPEAPLGDLTISAAPLWLEADPVHAAPEFYAALASAAESCWEEMCGEISPPASKRARLESFIVRPGDHGKSNSEAKPARPQGWSSGKLPEKSKKPPQRGRRWFRGGWPRFPGGRGRGFVRGSLARGRGGRGRGGRGGRGGP
jgi:hypothetical protein